MPLWPIHRFQAFLPLFFPSLFSPSQDPLWSTKASFDAFHPLRFSPPCSFSRAEDQRSRGEALKIGPKPLESKLEAAACFSAELWVEKKKEQFLCQCDIKKKIKKITAAAAAWPPAAFSLFRMVLTLKNGCCLSADYYYVSRSLWRAGLGGVWITHQEGAVKVSPPPSASIWGSCLPPA